MQIPYYVNNGDTGCTTAGLITSPDILEGP